jgi:voltage-gated potassium channel
VTVNPSWRAKVARVLAGDVPSRSGRAANALIGMLIVLNVVAVIAESHFKEGDPELRFFEVFELASLVVFSFEYLARLWTSPEQYPELSPARARIKFAMSFWGLIDLAAVLPGFVSFIDLRVFRSVRLLRLVRIFKFGRYSRSMRTLGLVFKERLPDLIAALLLLGVLLIIASTLMFYAEHDAQPAIFPHITSALWWGVETLSTLGYGDAIPITPLGRVLGSIVAVFGVGLFALPAGIVASGYSEIRAREAKAPDTCPHCQKSLTA